MTRLLYLPDDATVIQLEIDLSPAELVAAINAGLRPLPILRAAPPGKLTAIQVNASVIIAPVRLPGRPRISSPTSDLSRASGRCWSFPLAALTLLKSPPCSTFHAAR